MNQDIGRMARMNLSIPDELRQRMDAFDRSQNWSEIAAAAFRRKVDGLEYLASIKNEAKRRLEATEIEDLGGIEQVGLRDGADWAAKAARKRELLRLDKYADELGYEFESWEALVRVILGDNYDRDCPDWFGRQSQFGDGVPEEYETQYANAFAEGAMNAFNELS